MTETEQHGDEIQEHPQHLGEHVEPDEDEPFVDEVGTPERVATNANVE